MGPMTVLRLSASAMALGLSTSALLAAPEPSAVPVSWELTLKLAPIERLTIETPKGPRTFWYLLYTVTNNTGQDIDFYPEITRVAEVETEATAEQAVRNPDSAPQITISPAIVGVDSTVFAAIARRHARTHPFLVTPVDAIGKLLQGKDNARTSVAVFPDLDRRVSRFTIYFTGLSGEKVVRPNPKYDPRSPSGENDDRNPRVFVLRKTLEIPYTLPGDVNTRARATPALGRMTWVMR